MIIGVTGGIGSGKSVVSRLLTLMDVPVYIADDRSKWLLDKDESLKTSLMQTFGSNLYRNGMIDRPLFASLIFSDSDRLKLANSLIHPCVERDFRRWSAEQLSESRGVQAMESAILFESGFNQLTNVSVLVYAPKELRLQRAMLRDGASRLAIEARMNAQIPDEEKRNLADRIILNDESCSLIQQVRELIDF